MTTSDGAKPNNGDKKKKKPAEPRPSEHAYLVLELGQSLDDAETKHPEGFQHSASRLGPNLDTEYGRECARERAGLLPWLRRQHARCDGVGILARRFARTRPVSKTVRRRRTMGEKPVQDHPRQDHPLPSRRERVARCGHASPRGVQRRHPPA